MIPKCLLENAKKVIDVHIQKYTFLKNGPGLDNVRKHSSLEKKYLSRGHGSIPFLVEMLTGML